MVGWLPAGYVRSTSPCCIVSKRGVIKRVVVIKYIFTILVWYGMVWYGMVWCCVGRVFYCVPLYSMLICAATVRHVNGA